MCRSATLLLIAILLTACGGSTGTSPTTSPVTLTPTPMPTLAATPTRPTTASGATPASTPASQATPGATPRATASPVSSPAAIATATLVPTPAPPALEPLEGAALVEALRRGGYIIFFRHASTDFSQSDTDPQNLANCATQRNLNEQGRSESRAIGDAIRALGIPLGQVLSSEYCRTLDTANLAFGRAGPNVELTGLTGLNDAERNRRIEALRQMLTVQPAPGSNTVLVSHQFNLTFAIDVTLETEGEAAIFRPDGTSFRLVARVLPGEWATLGQ